jgi:ATP-dependent RNA helicase DHX36
VLCAAERSLTARPDVVFVIDAGKVKETRYDPKRRMVRAMSVRYLSRCLIWGNIRCLWRRGSRRQAPSSGAVVRAACKKVPSPLSSRPSHLAADAGAGQCFRLFSRKLYARMDKYTTPEMCRTPIHQLCLQVKVRARFQLDADSRSLPPPRSLGSVPWAMCWPRP